MNKLSQIIPLVGSFTIIALTSCKEESPEEPKLNAPQEEALKDFQESGEKTKEAYKIKVKRSKIDWDTKPGEQKSEDKDNQEKKE